MNRIFVTVIEHAAYLKQAEKLLTPQQMVEITEILAANPLSGEVMPGTGGCRKMRYAGIAGKGKSGGMRVIHLLIVSAQEVHALGIYAKSAKGNLTKAERNYLAKFATILKEEEK